jgi:hypothetical protein
MMDTCAHKTLINYHNFVSIEISTAPPARRIKIYDLKFYLLPHPKKKSKKKIYINYKNYYVTYSLPQLKTTIIT